MANASFALSTTEGVLQNLSSGLNVSNVTKILSNLTKHVATDAQQAAATKSGAELIQTIPMTFQLWFTAVVIFLVLVFLALDKGPPHHVLVAAVALLWNVEIFNYSGKPILTVTEALAGYSNPSMITVGGLFVAVAAIEKARLVSWLANRALGQSGQYWGSVKLQVLAFALSGFVNNIPMQAIMVPIICDWCRNRGFPSSKFLLSQDYATISGGMLTTIGTSTNLVVNGLLANAGLKPFSFFEPALIGLPCGILAMLWMLAMHRFLPDNSEVFLKSVRDRSDDCISAFQLNPESSYIGKPVSEILILCGLQHGDLLKIIRPVSSQAFRPKAGQAHSGKEGSVIGVDDVGAVLNGAEEEEELRAVAHTWQAWTRFFFTGREDPWQFRLIGKAAKEIGFDRFASEKTCMNAGLIEVLASNMSPTEIGQAGDTFMLTLRKESIIDAVACAKHHLLISSKPAVKQICSKSHFLVATVGVSSPLVNTPVRLGAKLVSSLYDVGLVAFCSESYESPTPDEEVGDQAPSPKDAQIRAGDKVILLAPARTELPKGEFLSVTHLASLKKPVWFYDIIPLLGFIAGVSWASTDETAMVRVSVVMFCTMVLGGWIKTDEVRHIMKWDILILIGASIALGTALSNSGIASALAILVRAAGLGPQGALFLLVTVVVLLNEIVTNNAAATLGIPLAIALTKELGLPSVRPYAMAVLVGGSAAYACPIGYATHMMVMGPGNYTAWHFVKFGTMVDIIYIVGVTVIVPWIYPLS